MGFVERESARLEAEIAKEPLGTVRFKQLFAAYQALGWATEPQFFAAPLDSIDGRTGQAIGRSLASAAGCLPEPHLATSSGSPAPTTDVA